MYQRNASLDRGNFKVYWSYNSTSDSLYFTLDVAATGWIGFGFTRSTPSGMMGYDVAVGGVRNGQIYLKDYMTNGYQRPPEDPQQDVKLMYAIERDGRTVISYSRKRDTGDVQDVAIEQGVMYYFIWAYHRTDDNENVQHQSEGFKKMIVIPGDPVTTQATSTGPDQGRGGEQDGGLDDKTKETRETITILLAVSLGLIVVCLVLISMGLAYFSRVMKAAT